MGCGVRIAPLALTLPLRKGWGVQARRRKLNHSAGGGGRLLVKVPVTWGSWYHLPPGLVTSPWLPEKPAVDTREGSPKRAGRGRLGAGGRGKVAAWLYQKHFCSFVSHHSLHGDKDHFLRGKLVASEKLTISFKKRGVLFFEDRSYQFLWHVPFSPALVIALFVLQLLKYFSFLGSAVGYSGHLVTKRWPQTAWPALLQTLLPWATKEMGP